MKRQRHGKQVLAVLLAFCLFLPAVFSTPAAVPAADTGLNSQMTPEEQQSYLEMKLRQTEKTLETLGKQSKDTQAYLDALDQKIGYLRSQLKLTEQKVDTAENRITVLQKQQKKNRQDQAALQQQITDTKQQITVLDAQFQQNYQRYCQRLRAMYISGETNVLAFLLGSTDIGQLLTRYEMVARVAKQDTALLRSVQTEGTRLEQAKTDLTTRQKDLQTKKTALAASQTELEQTVTTLQADQKDLTTRRQVLTDQQTEANRLLKQLTDKTKAYTEYRDVTQNDLDEIDRQIEEAAKKYTTTTTTTTTTTKKHTTTKHGESAGTTASTTKKHTTTESKSNLSGAQPNPHYHCVPWLRRALRLRFCMRQRLPRRGGRERHGNRVGRSDEQRRQLPQLRALHCDRPRQDGQRRQFGVHPVRPQQSAGGICRHTCAPWPADCLQRLHR